MTVGALRIELHAKPGIAKRQLQIAQLIGSDDNSSSGKINFSLSSVNLDGTYQFGDRSAGEREELSLDVSEGLARYETGYVRPDDKYMEAAFEKGMTKVDLYDTSVTKKGSSLEFSFKIKSLVETVPSVDAQTLQFVNKHNTGSPGKISLEIPPAGFSSAAELKSAIKQHCQSIQFGSR